MAIPGNLLSATTEMVDPNTSGWAAMSNCTIGLGSGGRNGDGTLRLTSSAAGEMRARTAASYPVVGGETYLVFADASASTQPERIGIRWLTAGGAEISITWSLTTASASSSWHRVSVAGVAPLDAAFAQVMVSATVSAASVLHYFENAYLGLPIRTTGNLLSFNTESGGEIDASGWAAETNTTVSRLAPMVSWAVDWYRSGGHVIAMTATGAGDASMASVERPSVEPGQEYLAHCYLTPPTGTADCWLEIRWYDAASALISTVRAYLDQPSAGTYKQRVSGFAPPTAASCTVAAGIAGASAGQILHVETAVVTLAPAVQAGTILPYADASFEQGVGQWTVQSGVATIARSVWSSSAQEGTYWLAVTSATATASTLRSGRYAITGGQDYRCQMRVYSQAGGWTLAVRHRWLDASTALISTEDSATIAIPAGGWWEVTASGDAPVSAASVEIEVVLTATASSSVLRLDKVAMWQALPQTDVEADPVLGRVVLTLRELTVGRLAGIWRIGTDGRRTLVRGPDGLYDRVPIESDLLLVEDYEAPLAVPVSYYVEMYTAATGAFAASRTSSTVTIDPGDPSEAWLTDPANPQRNLKVVVQRGPDWQRPSRRTEYAVRGRRNPVALSDVRGGLVGELSIWTRTDDERAALHLLLDSSNVLLWRTAPGFGVGSLYVTIGDVTEGRISVYGREPWRTWTLPLAETDMPTSGVNGSAGRTWQDILVENTTWDAVAIGYATWESVLLHQPAGG